MGKFAIQKRKLYEEVMDQIMKLISSGDYKVGDRLPSLHELSEMFEVGKPTLREALSVLAAIGALEIRHGSGIYVRRLAQEEYSVAMRLEKVESENLLYWLEFRRAVEVEAAGLAALRRTEKDIEEIQEAQKLLEQRILAGETGAHWDYKFHQRIALATHNPIFSQAITTTADILQKYFELSLKQSLAMPSRKAIVSNEHDEILTQICKGNSSAAKLAMLKHIDNVERKVKLLSEVEE